MNRPLVQGIATVCGLGVGVQLHESSGKAPNPIRHFPIDSSNPKLPNAEHLKKRYSAAPNLLELLDSKKKFRKRRNSIAHSAEAFGQRATYEEYKDKVAAATGELREALSSAKSICDRINP
jgi:hypothetical protein